MKSFLFLVMAVIMSAQAFAGDNDPIEIVLFAGQSNMLGVAKTDEALKGYYPLPGNIEYHNFSRSTKFKPADSRFGLELSFAKDLLAANPDKRYIFIKWAVGGSSINDWAPDWSPEKVFPKRAELWGSLYARALADIKNVLDGREVYISGLLWLQGEANSKKNTGSQEYAENLASLIAAFRKDLAAPGMRVLLGLVNPPLPRFVNAEIVREQMRTLAQSDPLVTVVSAEGLSKRKDDLHYDGAGLMEFGHRYASVWEKLNTGHSNEDPGHTEE